MKKSQLITVYCWYRSLLSIPMIVYWNIRKAYLDWRNLRIKMEIEALKAYRNNPNIKF